MLRKLFKYDFLAIGRSMWLLTLIVALTTAAGTIAGHYIPVVGELLDAEAATAPALGQIALMMLLVSIIVISFMAVMAYVVLATIMITKRYYTNLFTDEGYLTFTLPVKTSAILDAKILSGIIWGAIASIVSLICIGFLVIGLAGEDAVYMIEGFSELFKYSTEYIDIPAYHYVLLIIEYVLITVINFMFGMLLLYFCITFATVIVKKARVILGVGFYIGVTSILSTITQIVSTILPLFMGDQLTTGDEIITSLLTQMHIQMWFGIVLYGSVTIASYVLNKVLLKNKLNLV